MALSFGGIGVRHLSPSETIEYMTCIMQVKLWYDQKKYGEAPGYVAVGMSAERFGGDAGRPLVIANHPRHDAAGGPELQGISGMRGGNGNQHPG